MASLKTIYLVDDDEDYRFLIKEAIADAGIDVQVIEADNGQAFFSILSYKISDSVLLLDINMPVMNGIETLSVLKNTPTWSTLPVIMMSSADEKSLPFSPKEAGVTKFITKPALFEDYVHLIKELDTYCQ